MMSPWITLATFTLFSSITAFPPSRPVTAADGSSAPAFTYLRLASTTVLEDGDPVSALAPVQVPKSDSLDFIGYWTTDAARQHYKDDMTKGAFPLHIHVEIENFTSASCSFTGDGLRNTTCTRYKKPNESETLSNILKTFQLKAEVVSSDPGAPALPSRVTFGLGPAENDDLGNAFFWALDPPLSGGSCESALNSTACDGFATTDPFPKLKDSPGWQPGL